MIIVFEMTETLPWPWLICLVLLFLAARAQYRNFFRSKHKHLSPKHRKNVKLSYMKLETLRKIGKEKNSFGRQIKYLRKVDPFIFEDMILSALKERGIKIERNRRYTGDGGIDGRCWIPVAGKWSKKKEILIQAKRYSNLIKPEDVQNFSALCRKQGKRGLFIHTGRTGNRSWRVPGPITIISGQRMLDLLCDSNETIYL